MPLNNRLVRNLVRAGELLELREQLLNEMGDRENMPLGELLAVNEIISIIDTRVTKLVGVIEDASDRVRHPSPTGEQGVPGSDQIRQRDHRERVEQDGPVAI